MAGVGQADELGNLVDLVAVEALWIAAAVAALMYLHHDLAEPGESRSEVFENPLSLDGVATEQRKALGAETLFLQHLLRHLQHSQIVHQPAQAHRQTALVVGSQLQPQAHR